MTNTKLLEAEIAKTGIKKGKIAETLGISYVTLRRKIYNEYPFDSEEILKLCQLLDIRGLKRRDDIFFADIVD